MSSVKKSVFNSVICSGPVFFTIRFFLIFLIFGAGGKNSHFKKANLTLVYKESKSTPQQEREKKFKGAFQLQQISGFIESADTITRFAFSGSWQLWDPWSVSVSQAWNRHYFLNPLSRDTGIKIQDSVLAVSAYKKWPDFHSGVSGGLSSTLPFSTRSRVFGLVTVSEVFFNGTLQLHSLWDSFFENPFKFKSLSFFIYPFGRYYTSFYTTTPTRREGAEGEVFMQSRGGEPLPEFLWGLKRMGLNFGVNDKFSVAASYGRWVIFPYKTRFQRDGLSPYLRTYGRHYYLISFSLRFKPLEKWTLQAAYVHQNRVDRQGRREILLLDDRISVWSLMASYSFSL